MKVSRETFRTVRWLLVGALAIQLLIVPWRYWEVEAIADVALWHEETTYSPIFRPPPVRV